MPYSFNIFTGTFDLVGTGSAGGNTTQYKALKTVTPTPDGVITVFTIPDTYTSGTVTPYLNGLAESNFTETSPTQITFSTPPFTGEQVLVSYEITTAAVVTSTYGAGVYGTAIYA